MAKRLLKQFHYGQKGFTLIELLVVVAILGVLAAVAIPNVAKFINRGNAEAANTELATIETAVAAYQSEHLGAAPTGANWAAILTALGPYLQDAAKIKGSYTIASSGTVAGATYTGLSWNATLHKWE